MATSDGAQSESVSVRMRSPSMRVLTEEVDQNLDILSYYAQTDVDSLGGNQESLLNFVKTLKSKKDLFCAKSQDLSKLMFRLGSIDSGKEVRRARHQILNEVFPMWMYIASVLPHRLGFSPV